MLRALMVSALALGSAAVETTTNNGADGKGFVGVRSGRFDGKVCLITGATSGLGEFTAYHLAKEGCAVVVTGRREDKGKKVTDNIAALSKSTLSPPGLFVKVDVKKSSEQKAMIDTIKAAYGRLDAVFANAGVAEGVPIDEMADEAWDHVMDTNLKGVFYTVRESVKLLKEPAPGKEGEGIASLGLKSGENKGGSIVLCSSIFGLRGQSALAAYAASKHGLEGMKKSAAGGLQKHNIRINNVNPSWTPSEMTAGLEAMPAFKDVILHTQPGGELSYQGEVAAAVAYLLSADAAYINGHSLPVDGGMTGHLVPESYWQDGMARAMAQLGAANVQDLATEAGIGQQGEKKKKGEL